MVKNPKKVKEGKLSKARGMLFEKKTREDLIEKGFVCDKWSNNVDLINNTLIPSKPKYNFFTKSLMMNSAGFPDFIIYKQYGDRIIIGVESKMHGKLSRIEKDKCMWLLMNNVFDEIWVSEKTKVKNRIVVKYHKFAVK